MLTPLLVWSPPLRQKQLPNDQGGAAFGKPMISELDLDYDDDDLMDLTPDQEVSDSVS